MQTEEYMRERLEKEIEMAESKCTVVIYFLCLSDEESEKRFDLG
jgi:polyphosphate kinase 2 (PPK2 family)